MGFIAGLGPAMGNPYSLFLLSDNACWRFRLSDRKLERVSDLKNTPDGWFVRGLINTLITVRSTGSDEILSLDCEAP